MRWTRVVAGVTVAVACLTPVAADADEPSAASASTAPSSTPTLDAPDPLRISSSSIARLTTLAMRYEAHLSVAEEHRKQAAEHTRDANRQLKVARAYVAQVVDYAMSPNADPFAQRLSAMAAAEKPEDLISGIFSTEQVTDAQEGHLADAKAAFDAAQRLQSKAESATEAAQEAERIAARQLEQIGTLAEKLGLGASATPEGLPETQAEQRQWNREAVAAWKRYKRRLARFDVTPPKAAKLRRQGGHATATVGRRSVEVLPAQTIRMIDGLVDRIGDDYAPKNRDGAWSCGGVVRVAGAYDLDGSPAELYARTVEVDPSDIRRGDLVFSADEASGIHHVGVFIGDDKVIDAPATRAQVGVSRMPEKPFAVTRPSLGRGHNTPPQGTAKTPPTVCNAKKPVAPTRQGWTFPLKQGTYRISAGFGMSGGMWRSTHTGQDLAAPSGTPIYASRGGTVSLQEVGWAGTLITISHPDGTAERYAHSSVVLVEDGQTVQAGEKIALVGSRGNSTGPHLHFEIQVDGEFIDPMPVLVQYLTNTGAGKGWGGYSNGQVPRGVLCEVGGVLLRCDTAKRASRLAKAYERRFGRPLELAQGYRDIVEQIQPAPEGGLTDIPGTSPFGWGTRFAVGSVPKKHQDWLADRARALGLERESGLSWSFGA